MAKRKGTKKVNGELTITLADDAGVKAFKIASFGSTVVWKIDSKGNLITKGTITEQFPVIIP